jgi:hypothetical protein
VSISDRKNEKNEKLLRSVSTLLYGLYDGIATIDSCTEARPTPFLTVRLDLLTRSYAGLQSSAEVWKSRPLTIPQIFERAVFRKDNNFIKIDPREIYHGWASVLLSFQYLRMRSVCWMLMHVFIAEFWFLKGYKGGTSSDSTFDIYIRDHTWSSFS